MATHLADLQNPYDRSPNALPESDQLWSLRSSRGRALLLGGVGAGMAVVGVLLGATPGFADDTAPDGAAADAPPARTPADASGPEPDAAKPDAAKPDGRSALVAHEKDYQAKVLADHDLSRGERLAHVAASEAKVDAALGAAPRDAVPKDAAPKDAAPTEPSPPSSEWQAVDGDTVHDLSHDASTGTTVDRFRQDHNDAQVTDTYHDNGSRDRTITRPDDSTRVESTTPGGVTHRKEYDATGMLVERERVKGQAPPAPKAPPAGEPAAEPRSSTTADGHAALVTTTTDPASGTTTATSTRTDGAEVERRYNADDSYTDTVTHPDGKQRVRSVDAAGVTTDKVYRDGELVRKTKQQGTARPDAPVVTAEPPPSTVYVDGTGVRAVQDALVDGSRTDAAVTVSGVDRRKTVAGNGTSLVTSDDKQSTTYKEVHPDGTGRIRVVDDTTGEVTKDRKLTGARPADVTLPAYTQAAPTVTTATTDAHQPETTTVWPNGPTSVESTTAGGDVRISTTLTNGVETTQLRKVNGDVTTKVDGKGPTELFTRDSTGVGVQQELKKGLGDLDVASVEVGTATVPFENVDVTKGPRGAKTATFDWGGNAVALTTGRDGAATWSQTAGEQSRDTLNSEPDATEKVDWDRWTVTNEVDKSGEQVRRAETRVGNDGENRADGRFAVTRGGGTDSSWKAVDADGRTVTDMKVGADGSVRQELLLDPTFGPTYKTVLTKGAKGDARSDVTWDESDIDNGVSKWSTVQRANGEGYVRYARGDDGTWRAVNLDASDRFAGTFPTLTDEQRASAEKDGAVIADAVETGKGKAKKDSLVLVNGSVLREMGGGFAAQRFTRGTGSEAPAGGGGNGGESTEEQLTPGKPNSTVAGVLARRAGSEIAQAFGADGLGASTAGNGAAVLVGLASGDGQAARDAGGAIVDEVATEGLARALPGSLHPGATAAGNVLGALASGRRIDVTNDVAAPVTQEVLTGVAGSAAGAAGAGGARLLGKLLGPGKVTGTDVIDETLSTGATIGCSAVGTPLLGAACGTAMRFLTHLIGGPRKRPDLGEATGDALEDRKGRLDNPFSRIVSDARSGRTAQDVQQPFQDDMNLKGKMQFDVTSPATDTVRSYLATTPEDTTKGGEAQRREDFAKLAALRSKDTPELKPFANYLQANAEYLDRSRGKGDGWHQQNFDRAASKLGVDDAFGVDHVNPGRMTVAQAQAIIDESGTKLGYDVYNPLSGNDRDPSELRTFDQMAADTAAAKLTAGDGTATGEAQPAGPVKKAPYVGAYWKNFMAGQDAEAGKKVAHTKAFNPDEFDKDKVDDRSDDDVYQNILRKNYIGSTIEGDPAAAAQQQRMSSTGDAIGLIRDRGVKDPELAGKLLGDDLVGMTSPAYLASKKAPLNTPKKSRGIDVAGGLTEVLLSGLDAVEAADPAPAGSASPAAITPLSELVGDPLLGRPDAARTSVPAGFGVTDAATSAPVRTGAGGYRATVPVEPGDPVSFGTLVLDPVAPGYSGGNPGAPAGADASRVTGGVSSPVFVPETERSTAGSQIRTAATGAPTRGVDPTVVGNSTPQLTAEIPGGGSPVLNGTTDNSTHADEQPESSATSSDVAELSGSRGPWWSRLTLEDRPVSPDLQFPDTGPFAPLPASMINERALPKGDPVGATPRPDPERSLSSAAADARTALAPSTARDELVRALELFGPAVAGRTRPVAGAVTPESVPAMSGLLGLRRGGTPAPADVAAFADAYGKLAVATGDLPAESAARLGTALDDLERQQADIAARARAASATSLRRDDPVVRCLRALCGDTVTGTVQAMSRDPEVTGGSGVVPAGVLPDGLTPSGLTPVESVFTGPRRLQDVLDVEREIQVTNGQVQDLLDEAGSTAPNELPNAAARQAALQRADATRAAALKEFRAGGAGFRTAWKDYQDAVTRLRAEMVGSHAGSVPAPQGDEVPADPDAVASMAGLRRHALNGIVGAADELFGAGSGDLLGGLRGSAGQVTAPTVFAGPIADHAAHALGELGTRAPGVALGQTAKATVTTADKVTLTPEQERALSALNRDPIGTLRNPDEFVRRMGEPGRSLLQATLSELGGGAMSLGATVLAAPGGPVAQIPLAVGAKGMQKGVLDPALTRLFAPPPASDVLVAADGTPYRRQPGAPELQNPLGERVTSTSIDDMLTTVEGRPLTTGTAPVLVDASGRALTRPSALQRVAAAFTPLRSRDPVVVTPDGRRAGNATTTLLDSGGRPMRVRPGAVLRPRTVAGVDPSLLTGQAAAVSDAAAATGVPSQAELRTTLPAELDSASVERTAVDDARGTAAARQAGAEVLDLPADLAGTAFRFTPGDVPAAPLISRSTAGAMVGESIKQVLRAVATASGLPSRAVDAGSAVANACVGALCGSAGKAAESATQGTSASGSAMRTAASADAAAQLARAAARLSPDELARLVAVTGGGYVVRNALNLPVRSLVSRTVRPPQAARIGSEVSLPAESGTASAGSDGVIMVPEPGAFPPVPPALSHPQVAPALTGSVVFDPAAATVRAPMVPAATEPGLPGLPAADVSTPYTGAVAPPAEEGARARGAAVVPTGTSPDPAATDPGVHPTVRFDPATGGDYGTVTTSGAAEVQQPVGRGGGAAATPSSDAAPPGRLGSVGMLASASDIVTAPVYTNLIRPELERRGLVGTPEHPAETAPEVARQVVLDTVGTVPGQAVAAVTGDPAAIPGVVDAPRQSFFTTVPGRRYQDWYTGEPTSRLDAYGRLMQQPVNGFTDLGVAVAMSIPTGVSQIAGGLGGLSTIYDDGRASLGEAARLYDEGTRTDLAQEQMRRVGEAGAAAQRYGHDLGVLASGVPEQADLAHTGLHSITGPLDCGPGVASPCIVPGTRDLANGRAGVLHVGAKVVGDPSTNPADPRYGRGVGVGLVGDPSVPGHPGYGQGPAGVGHVGTGIVGDGTDRLADLASPAIAANQAAGYPDDNGMDMWSAGDARSMGVATPGSVPQYHRFSGGGR